MMVEIDDDIADKLVVNSLTSTVDYWEEQLHRYKDPDHRGWIALFSVDPDEDKKEIKKMIKAAKRVLSYYGAEV